MAAGKEDPRPWTHTTRLGQPAPTSPARRHRPRAHSAPRGRPWEISATPTSRTTRSGSSRSHSTARGRTAHLTAFFGRAARAAALTTHQIRQYQLARRAAGAATGTINRETSALHRMGTLAVHWGWLDTVPGFPDRLRENPPRQGFFEHPEYLAVRVHLPAPWQDILDLAYYSGWRKQEILGLTWARQRAPNLRVGDRPTKSRRMTYTSLDYVIRRRADGRTKRDIIRCLTRFLAREIYQRVMRDFRTRQQLSEAS